MHEIDPRYKSDVAKQLWKYNPEFCCINLDIEGLSPAICGKSYGTDEQMVVAAAAPQMLEALEMVKELPFYGADKSMTITSAQRCEIIAAIKKARGGE